MPRIALPFGKATKENKRAPYRNALLALNIDPVEDATTLAGLDGLLLTGGSDVDPAQYGATRHPETEQPDHDRDAIEAALIHEALALDLPVLAICRGVQILNVALGGTLVQHIVGHVLPGQQDAHAVAITTGSTLHSILKLEDYLVNSRHHQCIDRVAADLTVVAQAPDHVIEALEFPGKRFVLAVQWHPEDRTARPDAKLFQAFRDAVAAPSTPR